MTGTSLSGSGPSTTRSLSAGTQLGPYEIVALIDAGGMGEVYRAADTRLNRTVALKLLPESVAGDADRRQRFEREAELGSSLAHPHICAVYDVGRSRPKLRDSRTGVEADREVEVSFLVMEYVEGETLESRLMRGPLNLDDSLRYAIEITSAVEYAHRRGVLHRDLKPANIMITPTGLKLLDFGLAKASTLQATSDTRLATTQTLTEQGTLLGTVNYMSPEQLEGGLADARADIFAIGAIIYEMVTGQRAFSGASRASVIAAILREDPPAVSALRKTTPPALERAVQKCLAKDRERRWQTVRDLASELEWIRDDSRSGATRMHRQSSASHVSTWIFAGLLIAATTVATLIVKDRWGERPTSIQFAIQPPPGVSFLDSNSFMAVSPNGRGIVFVGSEGGRDMLWIQPLESLEARPLPGTEGARMPFWSPDSLRVGFMADDQLKTIDVHGGNLHTVCAIDNSLGGAWSADDVILIGGGVRGVGILRVAAAGGRPTAATTLDVSRKELAHNWPVFLPDGRHFLYRAKGGGEDSTAIFAGSIDSPERTLVLNADVNPDFAPPGYLVTGTNGTLVAQPFDPSALRLSGSPFVIKQPVRYNDSTGRVTESASRSTLVYRQPEETELRWFARNGQPLGVAAAAARYLDPELSPDGSHVAVAKVDSALGTSAISVIDLADRRIEPVTSGRTWDSNPVWSTDGRMLLFSSKEEGGIPRFYQMTIGAAGPPAQFSADATGSLLDRTADGGILFVLEGKQQLGLLIQGVRTLIQTRFHERQARLSHDKRWMAYVSDESGKNEVYVRPASGDGPKEQITTGGGLQPRWRQDDRELYYLAPNGDVMALDVTMAGGVVHRGTPARLFHAPLNPSTQHVSGRNQYDVSADGQKFIMNVPIGSAPITVFSNWQATLHR